MIAAIGFLSIALLVRPSDACGPDFPESLLTHRAETLETLWSGSFLDEAARLVPPPRDATPPIEAGDFATPIELATYQKAADAWHAGKLAEAERGFRAVLALPAEQRRHRSTYAAFMLRDWPLLHQLIRDGFYDEKYLAAFELGEDARRDLQSGHIEHAVHLYAEQAAAGDYGGALSLLFVVRAAMKKPASIERLLADDVGLHLLAAYYYTRKDELGDQAEGLWPELRARAAKRGVALDLVAAAAYRDGWWDDAATFARRTPDTVLGHWVLAKLALRDGDTKTAERELVQVEAAHPQRSQLDQRDAGDPLAIVRGELGIVALAQQRFTAALAYFRTGGHFTEATYVAERVLAVEELLPQLRKVGNLYSVCWDEGTASCWDNNLATVAGRRLMRAGRYDEAIPLLDPARQTSAHDLAVELRAAKTASDPFDRAEHLFAASKIVRKQGMEILGTEHAPDWAMYAGDYSRSHSCARGEASTVQREFPEDEEDLGEGCIAPTQKDRKFISDTEDDRLAASAPSDPHRFHYRYLASQLAEEAANLVPPRSQAFAELLCFSAHYVQYRDPARVQKLYKRYVHEGPAGFGGVAFGDTCEPPDFAHARTFERDHAPPSRWRLSRIWAGLKHRWKWLAIIATLLGAALIGRTAIRHARIERS